MTAARLLDCLAPAFETLKRGAYTGPLTVSADEGAMTIHFCRGDMKRAVLSADVALDLTPRRDFAHTSG